MEQVEGKLVFELEGVRKFYPVSRGLFRSPLWLRAVDGVSFVLRSGETLGVVGESGCGKSTLARLMLGLEGCTSGTIRFYGEDISVFGLRERRGYWRRVQIVFQNPYSSLNPRWRVGRSVEEPLRLHTSLSALERRERVAELFSQVGLEPWQMDSYPHQFSGGQRQRIGIARALALEPEVLICDEPTSALDVSVQSQILNLLMDLQVRRRGLSYLFISHNLAVVRHIADRVLVMYLGRVVELAPVEELFSRPLHPYTRALLGAILEVDEVEVGVDWKNFLLKGELPSPLSPPSGCSFRTRCPLVRRECEEVEMDLEEVLPGHWSACPFSREGV